MNLLAVIAFVAQVSNPTPLDLKEEGASQGLIFSLNCIGAELLCAVSGTGGSITFSGASLLPPFSDASALFKDDADGTKLLAFQLSGITTATTRTATWPNANITVVGLESGGSFSAQVNMATSLVINNAQGLFMGSSATSALRFNTTQNPDTPALETGTASNGWNVFEIADTGFNFANGAGAAAATVNPHVTVHDKDQNTTNYQTLTIAGLSGNFRVTLPETTVTAIVQIPVAAETGASGMLLYGVFATDGATPQTTSGRILFNVVNDGGTETCVLGTKEELDNTPSGTLTVTIACSTSPTNAVNITFDATSSLVQTTLEAWGTLILVGAGEPLPQ